MRGLLIYNSSFVNKQVTGMAAGFTRAFTDLGAELEVAGSGEFTIAYDGKIRLYRCGRPLNIKYDFALFWDKDIRLAAALENAGIPVFNGSAAIGICDNKLATFEKLCGAGIPMPQTLAAPLVFKGAGGDDYADFLSLTGELLSFPLIAKEAYGSLGEQVYLIKDAAELDAVSGRLKHKPHLYQKFIEESAGLDIRLYVIGGRVAGACERRNEADFRSNVQWGGKMRLIEPEPEYVRIAEKAAGRIGLEYCAVDFLKGGDGALLCEVNSNAFFGAYCALGGRDIAALYAEHILKKLWI